MTMKLDTATLAARYHELCAQRDSVNAQAAPLQAQLDAANAEVMAAQARANALAAQIGTLRGGPGWLELKHDIAVLARALGRIPAPVAADR
jgi:hypothetical protein